MSTKIGQPGALRSPFQCEGLTDDWRVTRSIRAFLWLHHHVAVSVIVHCPLRHISLRPRKKHRGGCGLGQGEGEGGDADGSGFLSPLSTTSPFPRRWIAFVNPCLPDWSAPRPKDALLVATCIAFNSCFSHPTETQTHTAALACFGFRLFLTWPPLPLLPTLPLHTSRHSFWVANPCHLLSFFLCDFSFWPRTRATVRGAEFLRRPSIECCGFPGQTTTVCRVRQLGWKSRHTTTLCFVQHSRDLVGRTEKSYS